MGAGASQWGLHLPLFSSQLWGQQTGPLPAQPPIIDLLSPHEGVFPVYSEPALWVGSARGQGGGNTSKLKLCPLDSRTGCPRDQGSKPRLHSLNGMDQKVPALAGQCDYPSPHPPSRATAASTASQCKLGAARPP